MKVAEIFASIQGESSHAGRPCAFVRLSGCNLRCAYCDTSYAYTEGHEMTEDGIVDAVSKTGLRLVEITGGEPLLQEEAVQLVKRLLDCGFEVLVETNGSRSIAGIDGRARIIMDIKTPGSGMHEENDISNIGLLKPSDEVKFVITDGADYEWAKDFIARHSLAEKCTVLLSPSFGLLRPEILSNWILKDRLNVRLNIQLHKHIGVR